MQTPPRSLFGRLLPSAVLALAFAIGAAAPAFGHGDDGKRIDAGPVVPAAAVERLEGVVDEIVVDDRVRHATHRHRELRLPDGSAVALAGGLADVLQPESRVEVTGRRAGKFFEVDGIRALAQAAPARKGAEAPNVEIEGTLAVAHADDFATGRAEFIYELQEDSGPRRRLELAALPPQLGWGMRLSVSGRLAADGASLRPSRITILADGPEDRGGKQAAVPAKAVNTVLVILANFNNTATPSFSQAQAQQVMVSNSNSVANYYDEVSYGGQTFNVTVTSWVTMNIARPTSCSTSAWQGIGTAANSAAVAANGAWNASNYGFVVYLFPQVSACGWNGLAYIGSPRRAWINGTNSFTTQVVTHEMGHNWGLYHAGSLDCGGAPIGGSCTVSEYGDPFDTMGNQRAMHFNAQQKRKLNWIASATVPTHSAGTVTYSLAPLESPGGALYAVRIPTAATNRTYWIEYRQPIGFDIVLSAYPNNGAQIRVATPFETYCSSCDSLSNDTQMLDMTPATSTFTDGTLLAGQSFTDVTYGININVLAASAGELTVQVSTGGSQDPSATSLTSTPNPSTFGATVTFTATVTGMLPTGSVSFADGGAAIAGCAAAPLSGAGNTRTATCATGALSGGVHNVVATYSGDGANAGSTSNTLVQTVGTAATTTGIASSANPSQAGAAVTFTATVAGSAPTGTVSFTDGGSAITGCASVTLAGSGNIRTAACSTSTLGAGSHSIVATYSGDASNAGSASPPLDQVVNSTTGGTINVALAANGGIASASSVHSAAFPVAAVNDGERTGATWGSGGGWNDASMNAFPDWVQIAFNGAKLVDRVVLWTLPDLYGMPAEVDDSQTFAWYGIVDFEVQAWTGAAWVTVATVSGNNLVKRTVTFTPVTTDRIRVNVTGALAGYARVVELEAWGSGASGGPANVALAANGGTASASSVHSVAFPVAAINDSDRTGATWGSGGGWNDASGGSFPDAVEIAFNGTKTIDRIVLYTLSDSYWLGVEPGAAQTFTQSGIVDFNVQAWNGASWVTVATVSGNNLVRRTVAFAPVSTDRIRVNVTHALAGYSRIVELEAWSVAGGASNVALAAGGGVATASSVHSAAFPIRAVNDNDRTGATWGFGGGWNDASINAFPDWAQVDFAGSRTIDRVVVVTLPDVYGAAVEPGDAQTFTQSGVVDFSVQAWNGASWVTIATVTDNNLVKRTVTFAPMVTDRIRVNVINALAGHSRIVELEAWGQ